MTSTTASDSATRHSPALARTFQVFVVLTALNVVFQYVTAGRLFPDGGPEKVHAGGAIVLHVVSGVAALAAVLLWRRQATTALVAGLAVVVLVVGFVQAATGGRDHLAIHVPGAMVLTAGVTWLLVVAFWRRPA